MALDLSRHPCFNDAARHTFARIHLPVAPECNVQCNFCKRIYDCANESRPGVTSALLTPPQALSYLENVLQRDPRIAVVGIAGPGDPFATPERTWKPCGWCAGCTPNCSSAWPPTGSARRPMWTIWPRWPSATSR